MAESVAPGARPASLNQKVSRGLGWSLVNNFVGRFAGVFVGIVLARILVPEDYGIFSAALILVNGALSMNELGVSLAVVRWPGSPARIAPTVTTLSLVWSTILLASLWFAAPAVAASLGSPESSGVIRALSLCIFFDAVAAVPAAVMMREFMQRQRFVIDTLSLVTSAGLSILLAARGWGPWALAVGFLAANVLSSVLTFAVAPARYPPGFDRSVAGELLRFGLPLAAASALVFLALNVDYMVVGRELGAEALGLYTLAFNMCSWPVVLLSAAIRRVSLAGFSRVAETSSEAAAGSFVRSTGLVLAASLPLSALLAAYAEPAISVVYGTKWVPAATAMAILCILSAVRIVMELGYDFFTALGRPSSNLVLQGVWFVLLAPALTLGARWGGIEGVAWAHAAVAVGVVVPLFLVRMYRHGVSPRALGKVALVPVLSVLAVLASAWVIRSTIEPAVLQLVVGGSVSALVAVLVLAPRHHAELRQLLEKVRRRRPAPSECVAD